MSINADINDKEFYGYVAQEMANGVIDSGIMAKASAETDFDENKSKALYIKMRVADLIAQNKQQEEEIKQLQLDIAKKNNHENNQKRLQSISDGAASFIKIILFLVAMVIFLVVLIALGELMISSK
jgi:hypothetical protein